MKTEVTDLTATSNNTQTVKSSFICTKICCAAEIPPIRNLLEPLPGVEHVMVNITMKTVVTSHVPSLISAQDIVDTLNKGYFGATIKNDGCSANVTVLNGRSQLYVDNICCASEIPGIEAVLTPIPGVNKVSINVTTKLVCVDHNTRLVSADELQSALEEGFLTRK